MTKLISPYPGISVYKNKYGQVIARAKPGPNKRIKTDPRCRLIREHGAAFGKAASIGKMIRHIFFEWLKNIGNGQLHTRLSTELMEIIKSGVHENRMEPQLTNGDVSRLDGFQFNAKASIYNTFFGHWSLHIENDNKRVHIGIPSFIPSEAIRNPNGGFSHFRLVPLIVSLNPRSGGYTFVKGDQGDPGSPVACDNKIHKAINLKMNIDGTGELVVIVALAIGFYLQTTENEWSPVAAGSHNALGIIKAYKVCIS